MQNIVQCPTCGWQIPPDNPAGFCPQCSAALASGSGSSLEPTQLESLPDTIFADQVTEPAAYSQEEHPVSPGLPPSLAGYMIIGPPRSGGMGTVWPAKQLGTRRTVAIKILGTNHLTASGRVRFIREVELSAQLQHPNIARIYDSGIHQGDYFYAMEMIDGVSIDQYVARNKLDQKQILELLRLVCEGVQHAHQRGVIHCDLKPDNILVSDDGQPHVLDFGLAQLTTMRCEGLTRDGAAPGTPSYMSPEQAAGRVDQIDTRSDVYSLGKICYELLVGQRPHRLDGPITDLLHRVSQEEVRHPREASRGFDRELSAVLLKALDRNPERRYSSAGELGRDIAHFQRGEPVTAMPASMLYQLRKWIARHRLPVAIATVALLVLVSLAIISDLRLRREAATRNAIEKFNGLVLRKLDPASTGAIDITADLIREADELSAKFTHQPSEEANVREGIGDILLTYGMFPAAQEQYARVLALRERSLKPDDPAVLAANRALAQVHRERGDLAEAEKICRAILFNTESKAGDRDIETLRAKTTLAYILIDKNVLTSDPGGLQEAHATLRAVIKQCAGRSHPYDAERLRAQSALVIALREQNDAKSLAEADSLSQKTLEEHTELFKADKIQTLQALHDRATILTMLGKPSEAIPMLQKAITSAARVLADTSRTGRAMDDHPDLLVWRSDLAYAMTLLGKWAEAEKIYRDVLKANMLIKGAAHPYTVVIERNLAGILGAQSKWDAAEWQFEEAARLYGELRGVRHEQTLQLMDYQAWAMGKQGKWREAAKIYERTLSARLLTHSEGDAIVKLSRRQFEIASEQAKSAATRPATRPTDSVK